MVPLSENNRPLLSHDLVAVAINRSFDHKGVEVAVAIDIGLGITP